MDNRKLQKRIAECERRVSYLALCVENKKGTTYEAHYTRQLKIWQRKLALVKGE